MQQPENIKQAKEKNLINKEDHYIQLLGPLKACFNYIFKINFKTLET